jgi:hypothetical protein
MPDPTRRAAPPRIERTGRIFARPSGSRVAGRAINLTAIDKKGIADTPESLRLN